MARAAIRVGDFHVDPAHNELVRGGQAVRLEPRVMEVLAYLADRPGRAVSRDELLAAVWPGLVVGDDALTQAIIKLRKALGDDAHRPAYIETISKRGYRLIAAVDGIPEPAGIAVAHPRSARPRLYLAAAVALTAVAAAAFVYRGALPLPWPIGRAVPAGSASLPMVAVLPLASQGADATREYFSDGITEDVIAGLGRFSGLRVMSLAAVAPYRGQSPSPASVREALGVRYIVSGSVRQANGQLRVAVALSDAERGELLWSERFDGRGIELFEVQDRIVRGVVSALHVKLSNIERERTFSRPTESLEAHDLVLQARWLLHQADRKANREARTLLARAQHLSPEYSEVTVSIGEAEVQRALYGWISDPADAMRRGEEMARRALANPDARPHARAHSLLSSIFSNLGRYEDSMRHAELALAANPSDVLAQYRRAAALLYVGRIEESIAAHEATQRVQPLVGAMLGVNFVSAYFTAGRYADALRLAESFISEVPADAGMHAMRAAALWRLGRGDEAHAAIAEVRRLSPGAQARHFGTRFREETRARHLQEALLAAGLE